MSSYHDRYSLRELDRFWRVGGKLTSNGEDLTELSFRKGTRTSTGGNAYPLDKLVLLLGKDVVKKVSLERLVSGELFTKQEHLVTLIHNTPTLEACHGNGTIHVGYLQRAHRLGENERGTGLRALSKLHEWRMERARFAAVHQVAMSQQSGGNAHCRAVDGSNDRLREVDERTYEPRQDICRSQPFIASSALAASGH